MSRPLDQVSFDSPKNRRRTRRSIKRGSIISDDELNTSLASSHYMAGEISKQISQG